MQYAIINLTAPADYRDVRNKLEFLSHKDRPTGYFTTKEDAYREAKKLASEHPQQQYAVMRVDCVFETTAPKVIVKAYNDAGELVMENK